MENSLQSLELENFEIAQIVYARKLMAYLRDNDPESLNDALNVEGIDVANESTNNLMGYFIQNLAGDDDTGVNAEGELVEFLSYIPENTKNDAAVSVLAPSSATAMDFSGGLQAQGRFLNAEGSNRSGCSLDDCNGGNIDYMSDCFDWCLVNEGGYTGYTCADPEATNNGESGLCEYQSGFGQFWGTFTNTLGNIAEDIGWDNIWSSFMGTDDDGQQTQAGNTTIIVGGEDRKEEGFNWGKLALGVLVTVAVVGGIVYLVRRKKD